LSAQTIASNFLELNTDALKTSLLNTTLLAPGSKLTFAIRAVGSRAISSASFDLEKYTSVRLTNRHKLNANTTDSGNPTAIDECIQICTDINATGSYTENSTNKFSFSFSDRYYTQTMDGTGGNVQTTVYDNDHGYTAQTLGSANSLSNQTIYYFFTIKFMDTDSTSYRCVEYTTASGSALTLPQNARTDYVLETDYNSGHKYYTLSDGVYTYVSPQPNEATVETQPYSYYTPVQRYFLPSSSGTSNCYAGLSFQINRIELSLF